MSLFRWTPRRAIDVAIVVVGLVVLADWLFHGQPIGWTLCAFALTLLATVLFVSAGGRTRHGEDGRLPDRVGPPSALRRRGGWVLVALLVLLAARMIVEPTWLSSLLFVAALWSLATGRRQGWPRAAIDWVRRVVMLPLMALAQPLSDMVNARRYRRLHPAGRAGGRAGVGQWILPLAIGSLFVSLFAIANPIIEERIRRAAVEAWRWITNLTEIVPAPRVGLWLLVSALAWTLLRGRVRWAMRGSRLGAVPPSCAPRRSRLAARFGESSFIVRCLLVFNVVFAVQNLLDVRYLLGGARLPDGMTYASYAHRGAYPLIAAALLAGAFVLATFRAGGAAESLRAPRRLVTLWLLQCVFLTATAAWRLWLYVDQYGLTRWRVATVIWMLLVALGLAAIAWRIVARRSNDWLVGAVSLATTAVLVAACIPAWDGLIAHHNVRHCREVDGVAQPLDLVYLRELGPSSIPALRWLATRTDGTTIARSATFTANGLHADLDETLLNWRAWTVSRSRVASADGARTITSSASAVVASHND